jgi:tripartite-type tricarboxylate transporter receptor subunit TctC
MNKINNLRNIVLATFAVASTLLSGTALAQTQAQVYPNKPLRLINPFAAGGGADIIARYIASNLSENLVQPVVVESKPGAGSMVGSDYAAKAAPDGYPWLPVTGA